MTDRERRVKAEEEENGRGRMNVMENEKQECRSRRKGGTGWRLEQ